MEKKESIRYIGPYKILRSLGKGGMGEVFLAYDPICEREVAIKCIKTELKNKKSIQNRFLREAKIASQLTHPSIIPIYSIHQDPDNIYYIMSYVEGETLRQVLRATKEQEKKGLPLHPIGKSIPALVRIFLDVCEAIAYTHSKRILHRDLKPENIIIGKYGEVMILDWGIAESMDALTPSSEEINPHGTVEMTRPGKVAGTIAYMAPERAIGKPSSILTDIYALGVILYQMLTLELPFHRGNLQAFRKIMKNEKLPDPFEIAPYREIPQGLVQIVQKCLEVSEEKRYQTVQALIEDITNIIEGKPEWVYMAELSIKNKKDWEFQENILFARHTAITRKIDTSEWVNLMVSKETFSENIRLSAEISIQKEGQGIGFLFNIPESAKRKSVEEGYCLWIGFQEFPICQLFRSNVLIMEAPALHSLSLNKWHILTIEKVNDHIRCYLGGELILSYSSHLPLAGTHVGLLLKDDAVSLRKFQIFMGSHNALVNCLAVPDAFFAHKDYDIALQEYRQIGKCFPGRAEGREALFRAGLTLLEKAKTEKGKKEKAALFDLAHKEFENLHGTPGAPLEYMGKSMVFEALQDHQEEAKYLEFALRKFPKHPLLPILEEHIIYRMHESSHQNRDTAYRMILLAIRYFPRTIKSKDTSNLINSLEKHWEHLPFLELSPPAAYTNHAARLALILAFWINRKETLMEIVKALTKHEPCDEISLENALFCLLELGYFKELKEMILYLKTKPTARKGLDLLSLALLSPYKPASLSLKNFFSLIPSKFSRRETRVLLYILKKALLKKETASIEAFWKKRKEYTFEKADLPYLDSLLLWHLLKEERIKEASTLLSSYSKDILEQEESPLFFPYGAYLYLSENPEKAMIHFSHVLEIPFPPTTSLPAHFLIGRIDEKKGWIKEAFLWEKKELYRQLALFFLTIGDDAQYKQFEKKASSL